MRNALFVALLALAACRTPAPDDRAASAEDCPKDLLAARGSASRSEGKTCGAATTGVGHFLLCSRGTWTELTAPPVPPPRASAGGDVRPDEGGMPEPVRVDLLSKVCAAAPCSGRFARIRVYYEGGRIHRYAHEGDIERCSHPPMVVFDEKGVKVGSIPLEPIVPGSPRAKELDDLRASLFGSSKHVTSFDCAGSPLKK